MKPHHPNRDDVALVLASGLIFAIQLITLAVLWDAVRSDGPAGLSENATQVLTGAFSGVIGLLGGYIGGRRKEEPELPPDEPPGGATPEEWK